MSAVHTPGPWIIDAPEKRTANIPIRCDDRRPRVATVYSILTPSAKNPDDVAAANARLIAAAPDLLAACEAVREHYPHGPSIDFAEALRSVNAAIAKARGQS